MMCHHCWIYVATVYHLCCKPRWQINVQHRKRNSNPRIKSWHLREFAAFTALHQMMQIEDWTRASWRESSELSESRAGSREAPFWPGAANTASFRWAIALRDQHWPLDAREADMELAAGHIEKVDQAHQGPCSTPGKSSVEILESPCLVLRSMNAILWKTLWFSHWKRASPWWTGWLSMLRALCASCSITVWNSRCLVSFFDDWHFSSGGNGSTTCQNHPKCWDAHP